MTPPEAPATGPDDRELERPPAVFSCPETLRQRADFLRAAQAKRQATPGLLVQARERRDDESAYPSQIRIGYTASKKIGNAVTRNRAKRRMRELARAVLCTDGRAGWDYVLVARPQVTVSRDFAELLGDLRKALRQIHRPKA